MRNIGQFLKSIRSPLTEDELKLAHSFERFYFIDILRTLAAYGTLIWHYYHFDWHQGDVLELMTRQGSPFYHVFYLFYTLGLWCVQLFWIISGFVFCHIYAQRQTTGKSFFINRFSRLYPLHLITFLVIAVAQGISKTVLGYQQLGFHDTRSTFISNLFFVQKGDAFNTVAWSVSAEIGVYVLFFWFSSFIFNRGILIPLIFVGLADVLTHYGVDVWSISSSCTFYFFIGCIIYYYMLKFHHRWKINVAISAAMFCMSYVLLQCHLAYKFNQYNELMLLVPVMLLFTSMDYYFKNRPFPQEELATRFGNLTYSLYLWHMPIQVIILTCLDYFDIGRGIFKSPFVFIAWFGLMTFVAAASYRWIELPLKSKSKAVLNRLIPS